MYKLLSILFVANVFAINGLPPSSFNDEPVPLYRSNVGLETKLTPEEGQKYRLPTNVLPEEYTVELTPYIVENNFTFDGKVTIAINVIKETFKIVLHQRELDIEDVAVKSTDNNFLGLDFDAAKNEYEFLTITTTDPLKVGKYFVLIKYRGKLNDQNAGFYRSSYLNKKGDRVWLATTQFESTDARRAFPCFDEPAIKAKFNIIINRDKKFMSRSNMPVKTTVLSPVADGFETDTFETTVPMSTYLVAFVVSDFQKKENEAKDHTVFANENLIDHADYTLEIAQKSLSAIEEFLGIDFHLPKMDEFAIPDFAAGAMENWGLVTYRQLQLIFDPSVSTVQNRQSITTTIAHEHGHQWFGNQVSPKWWDYIWLNEGFATYFEYYAASKAEPDWKLMDQFVIKAVHGAMSADGSGTTRAMSNKVYTPREIASNFDSIAYSKAGSVIRMIEHVLTTPVFRSGLTQYLKAKNFDAAEPKDLWDNFEKAIEESKEKVNLGDLSFNEFAETWNTKAGVPVVTVDVNKATGQLTLSQQRYLTNEIEKTGSDWAIPINYAVKVADFETTQPTDWLYKESKKITIKDKFDWVIVNKQQTGYYRVNYDDNNWKQIAAYLNSKNEKIHPVNRAQIVDDALNLARSGRLSYALAFDIVGFLANEVDYLVWVPAVNGFAFLDVKLTALDNYKDYRTYSSDLIDAVYKSVDGFNEKEKDSHLTRMTRTIVLKRACDLGHTECRTDAHTQLKKIIDNPKLTVSPDLQQAVYCGGIRKASKIEWEKLLERYFEVKASNEKSRITAGLGCSENTAILQNHINGILDGKSKIEEKYVALSQISDSGPIGVEALLDSLAKDYPKYKTALTGTEPGALIATVAQKLVTKEQRDTLEKLKKDYPETQTIVDASLVLVDANIQWNNKNLKTIEKTIDDLVNSKVTSSTGATKPTSTSPVTSTTSSPVTEVTQETTTPGGVGANFASFKVLLVVFSFTFLFR